MYKKLGLGATAIVTLMMGASAAMKLKGGPDFTELFVNKFGIPGELRIPIALLEIAVLLIYLFPRTSVLGAILLTGYLGGAVLTHVRVGDAFFGPLIPGVLAWAGLWLRDPRLGDLIPLKK
jgi:hypothetical protein